MIGVETGSVDPVASAAFTALSSAARPAINVVNSSVPVSNNRAASRARLASATLVPGRMTTVVARLSSALLPSKAPKDFTSVTSTLSLPRSIKRSDSASCAASATDIVALGATPILRSNCSTASRDSESNFRTSVVLSRSLTSPSSIVS